jgi:DNA polymerase I-like protein with 3'-5' exonuclease and polymerase domains
MDIECKECGHVYAAHEEDGCMRDECSCQLDRVAVLLDCNAALTDCLAAAEAENKTLREVLEPFARVFRIMEERGVTDETMDLQWPVTEHDLRQAAAALKPEPKP